MLCSATAGDERTEKRERRRHAAPAGAAKSWPGKLFPHRSLRRNAEPSASTGSADSRRRAGRNEILAAEISENLDPLARLTGVDIDLFDGADMPLGDARFPTEVAQFLVDNLVRDRVTIVGKLIADGAQEVRIPIHRSMQMGG
jgi:hypothetical protein